MALFLICLAGLLGAAVLAVWTAARPGAIALLAWLTGLLHELTRASQDQARARTQPLTARGR